MSENSFTLRIAIFVLALIGGIAVWASMSQEEPRLVAPPMRLKTADERRATLREFEAAWRMRPSDPTPDNARAEKDFINQTAILVDRTFHQEIGQEAFALYRTAVLNFFSRYGSEDILGQR